jgi:hypothetical protein
MFPSQRSRRIARVLVGAILVPLTCLTTAMFLTTAGPVPEAFSSWKELGCVPEGEAKTALFGNLKA